MLPVLADARMWDTYHGQVHHTKDHPRNIDCCNEIYVDIIVRKIAGGGREREMDFEIRGIHNLVNLHLKSSDGIYKLNDEIEIGIRQVGPGKSLYGGKKT